MNELWTIGLPVVGALLAGIGIGFFYFWGLWLTVRRLTEIGHPGLLFVASFMGRMLVALGLFYLVIGVHWERAVAMVFGFLLARHIAMRRWGPAQTLKTA